MASEEDLDETDRRVLEFVKSYDFETYPWNTAEAAAELGLAPTRVYQALTRIQKFRRSEVFVYFRDGGIRIQTE